MEEKDITVKRKKRVLAIVLSIAIILLITSIYMLLIRKDDESKSNIDNDDNNIIAEKERIYKSKDGKFTLKIVDKNDEKAKQDLIEHFKKECDDCFLTAEESVEDLQDEILYYAYFNDIALFVDSVVEDDHYATYGLAGYDNAYGWGFKLIVNKDTNTIEIRPEDLIDKESDCMKSSFCGFMWSPSFVKTNLGYFFIDEREQELYTTDWKKLGYVQLDYHDDDSYELKEVDSSGVTVYKDMKFLECNGDAYPSNCKVDFLNPIKYDANGNIVTD